MMDLNSDVHLETLENHSIDKNEEVLCTTSKVSWMNPIVKYLKLEELPDDPAIA